MATDSWFTVKHITGVGGGDLNKSYSTKPEVRPTFQVDELGLRLFEVVQNRTSSTYAQGALVKRLGDKDGLTSAGTITAGTTLSATTSGLTANKHVGAILYVTDDAGAAGAAPESESAPVIANTATLITLDPKYPLTAAIAASDTASLMATYNTDLAAADDINTTVKGVILAQDGIPAAYHGFAQSYGVNHHTLMKASTAITVDDMLIADTGRVTLADSGAKYCESVGKALVGASSDIVSDFILVFLACGSMPFGALSDQDAVV